MRKLSRTEIGMIIAVAVVIVTINAWWRVKETGRRAKWVAEHQMLDAGLDGAGAPDGTHD